MDVGVFEQVAVVLFVCVAVGALAVLLRQPLIVALIAAGIIVGPNVLGLVESTSEIELLAKIGISLLLFVVGLKLDVRLVSTLGPVALATGLGQVLFTSVVGFGIATALGFDVVPSVYIAVALTFSSTIIVVKVLGDRREIDDLHGRIALGILIVQDIMVVLAMIAVTAIGSSEGDLSGEVLGVLIRGTLLLAVVGLVGRYLARPATRLLARSAELLVLAAVSWAVLLAAVSIMLGFTEEVGAFLAGMSLASTPYREALSGRLSTLRDFLLVFFFIELGTQFDLGAAWEQAGSAVVFAVFVLLGKPVIVMIVMGLMGYRKRVGFKAGTTLAQISEFSLIFVALGMAQGHIGDDVTGLVTAVGLVTISVSTYLIYGADRLFSRIEGLLDVFERPRRDAGDEFEEHQLAPEFVVIGLGRFGSTVLRELMDRGDDVLGVDFDPRSTQVRQLDCPAIFGDAEDPDLPEQLPLASTRWVISTLRNRDVNVRIIAALRSHGYRGRIAAAADDEITARLLEESGADLTIRPFHVAAAPLLLAIHRHEAGGDVPA